MKNLDVKDTENQKPKFTEKYGVLLMVVGLIASIYILKFILDFIEKLM